MFYLISTWINVWVNNCKAGDLKRRRTHNDVIVMQKIYYKCNQRLLSFSSTFLDIPNEVFVHIMILCNNVFS